MLVPAQIYTGYEVDYMYGDMIMICIMYRAIFNLFDLCETPELWCTLHTRVCFPGHTIRICTYVVRASFSSTDYDCDCNGLVQCLK